jgi:hypothetical protein
MISDFLTHLRDGGVSPQLDLGNFSVGIATMLIALVSLLVAFRSTRGLSNHRVAEFREKWIQDLRFQVSRFIGLIYEILNHSLSAVAGIGENRQKDLDIKHSELKQVESYIVTMLNSRESDHRMLVDLLAQLRGRAAGFSLNPTGQLANEADELVSLVTSLAKLIFKTEWDRARDDTYGRGRLNRKIRELIRDRKYRNAEDSIRLKASAFLDRIGISTKGAL